MSYQYSPEAQKRISTLGQASITAFIEEVPKNFLKNSYKILPKVQGFRPDTPAEFKEKQKRLIAHLSHPQPGIQKTSDWMSFAFIWDTWARLRLGKRFPTGDEVVSTSEGGLAFLLKLEKLFPDAERETMEQLFKFSCFPDHDEIQIVLARFQPASVIARNRMINGFSSRIEKIEESLDIVKKSIADVAKRMEQLELVSGSFNCILETTTKHINQNSNEIALLRNELRADTAGSRVIQKNIDELSAIELSVKNFIHDGKNQNVSLEKRIEELSKRGKIWDDNATELTEIKTMVSDLLMHKTDEESVLCIRDALLERVNTLESVFINRSDGLRTAQTSRLFEYEADGELSDIYSVNQACSLVASNLKAVGVIKAAMVARQIVATLIAGQMVQFSGSLANLVADAVAAAIGGPVYHEWRVPIGLMSGEIGADYVETIMKSSGCLLLKGANLSAFEVYGTEIRDIVIRRQYILPEYGQLALISTWAQGPAVFPDGGALAELGPVFDTDSFKMRGVLSEFSSWKYGRLVKEDWRALDGLDFDEANSRVEELKEFLKEADFDGGNLWRRLINRFLGVIRAMPEGSPEDDLRFLLISWAIPWAKVLGVSPNEINRIVTRELIEQNDASD